MIVLPLKKGQIEEPLNRKKHESKKFIALILPKEC